MNPKTVKSKSLANRAASKNGHSSQKGSSKKSINERWIEKYGIDDSKAAQLLLRALEKTYENRNKRIN